MERLKTILTREKFRICRNGRIQPRELTAAFSGSLFISLPPPGTCTWNMLRPSDDDHQLSVGQVAQCGEGFDVTVGDGRVGHGIDLLRFSHQQMGNNLVICRIRPEHYKITSSSTLLLQTSKRVASGTVIRSPTRNPTRPTRGSARGRQAVLGAAPSKAGAAAAVTAPLFLCLLCSTCLCGKEALVLE